MKVKVQGYELAPAEFYLEQMQRLVKMFGDDVDGKAELGLPIMSFFMGKPALQPKSELFSGHIVIFLNDKKMRRYVELQPQLFFNWITVTFHYFLAMAAFPQLAREIWLVCWSLINMLESAVEEGISFDARCQMAGWAANYDKNFASRSLNHIKSMKSSSNRFKAYHSLFLSTSINKGHSDFISHTLNAMKLAEYLSPIHKIQAYVHYYCNVEATNEILNFIISATNWPEMEYYCLGKMGMLETVVWTMQHNNNYDDLLFLQRCLKHDIRREDFQTSHAFLLPSMGETFVALKKSEKISYPSTDNGESYLRLMKLCNKINGVAISIRGEEDLEVSEEVEKFEDYGTPTRSNGFDELKNQIIRHYHLEDDFYKELNLISLVPSHNHPIQSALCSIDIVPPIISTSLQDLTEESQRRYFIFFLSSATYTHQVELNWIQSKFGKSAEIYTDPDPDFFIQKLCENQYSHIYISAHGQHDHWERLPDRIHFSECSEISIEKLKVPRVKSAERRTILLNICDGAATRISFNINNAGLAATLASSDQIVVSHLWPVDPKYAAIFGILMLDRLINESANLAALHVYSELDQPNFRIAENIKRMGPHYVELAQMVTNTNFEIADFRNIGSLAIYG